MVRIKYKTGSVRNVPDYVGKRLVERRIADYFEVAPAAPVQDEAPTVAVVEPALPTLDLEALTRDELFDLAVARGLDPHPQLGAKKLRAMMQ